MKTTRSILFASLCATVAVAACSKGDADKQDNAKSAAKTTAAAPDPAAQEPPATKDPMTAFKACWAAFNAKDASAYGNCYDDDSQWSMVDTVPPMAGQGREASVASVNKIWAAFPDIKSEPQLVLHNGNKFASIILTTATNKGEFMGMPPTNKPISIYETQLVTFSDAGTQRTGQYLTDHSVMAHQLGMMASERAPDSETPWPEQQWRTAKNDAAEQANLALVKKMGETIAKGDHAGYLTMVADDISFRYAGDKTAMNGMAAYKQGFKMWADMADHSGQLVDVWAAGEWVVSVSDFTHTMKVDFAGVKGTKGKAVKTRTVEFMQVANGKLKTHWVFENGMAYAAQLGLMDQAKRGN